MDQLHQLFARSLREIEAHASELAETETGRYFINEAAQLLAALRLWAQHHYRSGEPPRFRIPDPIRSGPERRMINARTAQKVHA